MTAVYDAWCGLKDVHAALIARTAARYGLTADRVLRSSLLCIALHDVGKLTRNFRGMMLADGEAAYREAVKRNYRHEVASLWLVTRAARDMNKKGTPFPGDGLLETLAVAGHHKYLADGFLLDGDKFRDKELTWDPDLQTALNAAYGLARLMFQEQGWKTPQLRVTPEELTIWLEHSPGVTLNGPFDWLIKCVEDLPRDGVRYRDLFMLLKGLLMTADWMASGAVGRDEDLDAAKGIVRVAPGLLEGHLRDRVESRINDRRDLGLKPFTGYKPFQVACGEANGHVIAIAPTGSGKTEASWLWALRQVERGHARKIIVLLPTMVTANSIHQRLRRFFKKQGHEVGLVHSTSDLVRASEAADEADRADVRADHLSETHFFRPVTVGTVDQLLVSLFHAGRWAMKTTAAADAAIVIDEIHAYEPHTLGLITLMIEQLVALGARFMIMSATMPDALKRTLRDVLTSRGSDDPGVNLVEEPTLLDSARNMWQTSVTSLSEWLFQGDDRGRKIPSAELLDLWKWRNDRGEPNRILIVVNTVKRCQDLAKALREFGFDLVCYHSKFIFDDRRKKERRIDERPPRLLIATQVVEVSLDIDYDILLTECAPIDALVQRAGRVNRARRDVLGRVVVHPYEAGSEIVYGLPRGILDRTWELCRAIKTPPTERDLIVLVETAYDGYAPGESPEFAQIRKVTLDAQAKLHGVLDSPRPYEDDALLKTRKEDYPQVSVIPAPFADTARDAHPRDRKRYELKVPVWYARNHKVAVEDLPICPMSYGREFGAELIPTKDHPEPGHEIF